MFYILWHICYNTSFRRAVRIVFDTLYAQLNETAPVAVVIIALSLMLLLGFLMTRVTKLLRLPNVTAYIVTGHSAPRHRRHGVPSRYRAGVHRVLYR